MVCTFEKCGVGEGCLWKVCMSPVCLSVCICMFRSMGLYHPLDGITNLKYKLFFSTPNKKISKRKALAFNRGRCCHLAICLRLILFHLVEGSGQDRPCLFVCVSECVKKDWMWDSIKFVWVWVKVCVSLREREREFMCEIESYFMFYLIIQTNYLGFP